MYYVYILINEGRNVLYIGIMNNIIRRTYEHKVGLVEGFTKRYRVKILVYFEEFQRAIDAITREKQLKNWHREWKFNLIRSKNPELKDLYDEILK